MSAASDSIRASRGSRSGGPVDRRLLARVPVLRRLMVALAALLALGAVLTVVQAVLLAHVVVEVFTRHVGPVDVVAPLLWLGGVGVARAALSGVQEWMTARASVVVRAQLRRSVLDAVARLGPTWARSRPPGTLAAAVGPGPDALDGWVTRALPALVGACVVPPVVLVTIGWTDWQSGLILLVLLPLVPLFLVLIGITTGRLVERQYAVLARLSGQFLDLLRGLTTLRIYGRAPAQEATLERVTDEYRRSTLASLRIALLSGLALDLIATLSVAVVAVDMGLRLDSGSVAFSTALVVLLLAPELFAPLRAVGAQHHAAQEGSAAASAALDIVDEADGPDAADLPADVVTGDELGAVLDGSVTVADLVVRYPGRTDDAVTLPALTITPGSVVALTGPSGSGKSTVLGVLLRFVDPAAGGVWLGTGTGPAALGELDAVRLRSQLAWVPQRPTCSRPTVADEVRLGEPDATDDEVAAACRACCAPDPRTPVGEDGSSVSAGQRRRIALARCLLRARRSAARGGVPIVLLDEPSEDLDAATQTVVAEVIGQLAGWATVLVATHSDQLAALADLHVGFYAGLAPTVRRQTPQAAEPALGRAAARPHVVALDDPAPSLVTFSLRELCRRAGATRRLVVAGALSAASALCALGLTASSLWLISRAAQHPNVQALAIAVVGVRLFAVSRAVLRYTERLATHDGALRMLSALRVRVFAALTPLSPHAIGRFGRGDLLRRFVGDVDGAQEGLVRAVVPSCGALAGSAAAVVLAATLVPSAAVVLAVALVAAGLVVPLVARAAAGSATELVAVAGARDRAASSFVDALPELEAFGATARSLDSIVAADRRISVLARRPASAAGAGVAPSGGLAALTLPVVLALAASAVRSGNLAVVDVGVLAVCVLVGFDAVSSLPAALVAWTRCRAGLERVSEVLSAPSAVPEPVVDTAIPAGPLGLIGRSLGLSPAPDAPQVLVDADFALTAGSRIAVTGPSGCGKSTLLAAALRLVPVTSGRLKITGPSAEVGLADVRAATLPPLVAGSLQGDHVFDATLRDNLRVVRPEADDAALDGVADRVGLRQFVRGLPAGWSTPAGPDGANLSGGQRQRLLIARALLADPDVLVLDEPTAHLDAETERLVLGDLLDATTGRTILLSTHRSLPTGSMDAVVRFDGASLVTEQATPDRRIRLVRARGPELEPVPGAASRTS